MKKLLTGAMCVLATPTLLTACSHDDSTPAAVTVTVTESATSSASSTVPTSINPADFHAPTGQEPVTQNGRTIKACNEWLSGLTLFSDDTIGYTEYCENMYPDTELTEDSSPVTIPEVEPLGSLDDNPTPTRTTPTRTAPTAASPTFNPDSADGYGPDQELPPLCVRFPDQYKC
ncbi:hypothetical protein [Corynebacterium vitaeruminis]|uniref:Secreted protein n=2 Tax=Corynebacterium vitaeruminis TaxID=38305 RepID=W5XYF9_9CORY|nr:hypothetical protein [Corynebacterium vitaeruminis]AHI21720.1 hypothetical protein B843_01640 [Corynebacterium vitaeruminis DSM 20294]